MCGLLLLKCLLLVLVLLIQSHLVSPWVIGLLWLQELLLGLLHLLETSLLRLLITIAILECGLLRLQASRLAVRVIVVTSWLSLHWVAKPIDSGLLLVALVKTGRLWLLCRCIIEQKVSLFLILKLSLSQFLLFLAQLDCLGEIIICLPVLWLLPLCSFIGLVL